METAEPPSMILQIAITIVALIVLYGVMTLVDKSMNAYGSASKNTAVLIADTTGNTSIIPQSPQSGAPMIYPSSGQPTGIEFSYSCFLKINSDTFTTSSATTCSTGSNSPVKTTVLKHIFSKGTSNSFPLMAPGVFCRADKNTLRIYMNTTNSWNNFVEVDNIPIGDKWFHLVILLQGYNMQVVINGNIVSKYQFNGVPSANIGPVFVLNNRKFPDGTSVQQADFVVDGAAKAMISRLQYYAYALNASQIDNLYRQGPSSKSADAGILATAVPYLADNWSVGRSSAV